MGGRGWTEAVLDWIYPSKCGLCGFLNDEAICAACRGEMSPALDAGPPDNVDEAFAIYQYTGRAAQAVKRLKYERITSLAKPLALNLAEKFETEGPDVDLIVPVPIHWTRRCFRGFNQAEMLCEDLPAELVDRKVLARRQATRPQAGLTPVQRATNLTGAFRVARPLSGERILLVDDVTTSGHTASECARALIAAGAGPVYLLTFAVG